MSHSEGKSSSSRSGGATQDNGGSTPAKAKRKGAVTEKQGKGAKPVKSNQATAQHMLKSTTGQSLLKGSPALSIMQKPRAVNGQALLQKRPSVDDVAKKPRAPPTIVYNLDALKIMSTQNQITNSNKPD